MIDRNARRRDRLEYHYQEIKAIVLSRQSAITGLMPASTAITEHGNYTDAWVRDNVYSILCVWGLALAYRKLDENQGRAYELECSVIKLMRGLLMAMMRQAHKLEDFKHNQALLDSLHAKYDTHTGDVVVGDAEWGHLQLDATSLYLLMLAQMTSSGLAIIYTLDEVNFVQNLVYYIGRTYRTPDYGIWERGNKINRGNPELNCSSIGMAKAALEAINGLDLFGVRGSQASVIHVLPDEIARSQITLESLLPRESNSKEIDAALLSIISFPAFAIENRQLVNLTRYEVITKLQGKYGCKRFLRDGHQTILEDTSRLHYEPQELLKFQHIESEWPLFFTYLFLDGLFRGDDAQVKTYKELLQTTTVEQDGWHLLPEIYYVPADKIEAEKAMPGSQKRSPNPNVPLVWAQSLYILGQLVEEGLINVADIDPLNRRLRIGSHREPVVQVALIAEDQELQQSLENFNIITQTPQQVAPIQVRNARELAQAYAQIGRNDKLGLSGRPIRRLRSLTTAHVFQIRNEPVIFLPSFLDQEEFYLTLDYHFLIDQLKGELNYIRNHWHAPGRPTLAILITHTMLKSGRDALLALIQELKNGECAGVQVRLGPMAQLALTAGRERIDFLHEFEFDAAPLQNAIAPRYFLKFDVDKSYPISHTEEFTLEYETDIQALLHNIRQSDNLYEQIELLQTLHRLQGLEYNTYWEGVHQLVSVADLLDEVYQKAGTYRFWAVVRRAAGLLNKTYIGLSDAVTDILVRQKQISVGKSYSEASLLVRPMRAQEIISKIDEFCGEDIRDRVLTQEILIYSSMLLKSDADLFAGMLTLRTGYLILLLISDLARELQIEQDEAHDRLMQLSPFEIKDRLYRILANYAQQQQLVFQQESLQLGAKRGDISWDIAIETNDEAELPTGTWHEKRRNSIVTMVPSNFYPDIWQLLQHCKGLVIGDKLERRNRLESELILSEMTPGEKNFAMRIDHLLNKIQAPQYRQLTIEALLAMVALVKRNPDLMIEDYIVLDVVTGHAVRLAWLDQHVKRARAGNGTEALTPTGSVPQSTQTSPLAKGQASRSPRSTKSPVQLTISKGDYDKHKAEAWQSFYDQPPDVCAQYIVRALQFLVEMAQPAPLQPE
ncbi:phosphorylase kinase alphabeta [Thalassoporum mexicanum PCC 7367]|uniref:glycoside hydrolase family 15 protein n=1 Tax=Thalassoporum mexicanum TaxID=3457544 RepID=UPI00029FBF2A|nr:glycoside hydrolase family 15 protein [Pseudanabaena sp. PCC 7367]AFY69310.1 phosphorylase kinase alphabeta [Pseudanabaena sp. PCC 7367]